MKNTFTFEVPDGYVWNGEWREPKEGEYILAGPNHIEQVMDGYSCYSCFILQQVRSIHVPAKFSIFKWAAMDGSGKWHLYSSQPCFDRVINAWVKCNDSDVRVPADASCFKGLTLPPADSPESSLTRLLCRCVWSRAKGGTWNSSCGLKWDNDPFQLYCPHCGKEVVYCDG